MASKNNKRKTNVQYLTCIFSKIQIFQAKITWEIIILKFLLILVLVRGKLVDGMIHPKVGTFNNLFLLSGKLG